MVSENDDQSAIAVIWYDGSQECKILNVSATRDDNDAVTNDRLPSRTCDNNGDTSSNSDDDKTIVQRGIDNAAFVVHAEQDCVIEHFEDDSPSSSSVGVVINESSAPRDEQVFYTTSLNSTSHSAVCSAASFSGETSNSNAHDNPAFEMPTELSYDAVVKRSPVHPNVYLVRRRNSGREFVTSCSCLTNGRRSSDEVILQVQPSELVDDITTNILSNSDEAIEDNKLHFLTSGTITPDCNIDIADITCCSDKKTDGEECSEPPPQYSSLRFMFLEDEPPKYQDVTGKKLTIGDPPKIQQTATEKWKRRIIVVAVIIFIVLIGALLVYACFVSGHPLGAYGSVPRKF